MIRMIWGGLNILTSVFGIAGVEHPLDYVFVASFALIGISLFSWGYNDRRNKNKKKFKGV